MSYLDTRITRDEFIKTRGVPSTQANAGVDQNLVEGVAGWTLGNTINLDGSGSSDPDGDTITFSWSFTSVPNTSTVTLSGETTTTPSFVPDLVGTYDIQLTVSDGRKTSTDSVTITVS